MAGLSRIIIDAPPELVWALISDVTRMGEWSPETIWCRWLDGTDSPRVGARFRGRNQVGGFMRWSTTARVTGCEPGREFAFTIELRGRELTRWRYALAPEGAGTEVTESYEIVHIPLRARGYRALVDRDAALLRGMDETLRRLKAAAESARSGTTAS